METIYRRILIKPHPPVEIKKPALLSPNNKNSQCIKTRFPAKAKTAQGTF